MQNQRRLFLGCFVALIATAFGFIVRASILNNWRVQFDLSNEEIGNIGGAGLFPFAISIILFSLVIDKIGYGRSMVIAFVCHVSSVAVTLCAPMMLAGDGADPEAALAGQKAGYWLLYVGTFIYALGNGVVEAVINPVVATVFDKEKTHWLNILHAGWPGGLVLGGLLAIGISYVDASSLPGDIWQWQIAIILLPMLAYGVILAGQKFPVQERVAAGVSYMDMLKEFGAGSCYIVCYLLVAGINQIVLVFGATALAFEIQLLIALVPTAIFAMYVKSFGRPMFVFLLLIMFLLATTELGTDNWISDIMRSVLDSPTQGTLFLVYTSAIMFVLRFFAGPIVHKISPLGLLATCAAVASVGLVCLSLAGNAVLLLFLAATLYGFGKTFFWPTTLGVVSEQYPKGGTLMLNAIAGVGMISVGVLGAPGIGILQDKSLDEKLAEENTAIHQTVMVEKSGMFGEYKAIDQQKMESLSEDDKTIVDNVVIDAKQGTLSKIAVLPAIMCVCYVGLIFFFRSRGGYKAEVLAGHAAEDEKFTGGVEGPVE